MFSNRRHPGRTLFFFIFTTLPILVIFILLDDDISGIENVGPLALKWLPGALVVGVIVTIAFDLLCHQPIEKRNPVE